MEYKILREIGDTVLVNFSHNGHDVNMHFEPKQIENGRYKTHVVNAFGKDVDDESMVPDISI